MRRLPGPRLAAQHDHVVLADALHDTLLLHVDGQTRARLLDLRAALHEDVVDRRLHRRHGLQLAEHGVARVHRLGARARDHPLVLLHRLRLREDDDRHGVLAGARRPLLAQRDLGRARPRDRPEPERLPDGFRRELLPALPPLEPAGALEQVLRVVLRLGAVRSKPDAAPRGRRSLLSRRAGAARRSSGAAALTPDHALFRRFGTVSAGAFALSGFRIRLPGSGGGIATATLLERDGDARLRATGTHLGKSIAFGGERSLHHALSVTCFATRFSTPLLVIFFAVLSFGSALSITLTLFLAMGLTCGPRHALLSVALPALCKSLGDVRRLVPLAPFLHKGGCTLLPLLLVPLGLTLLLAKLIHDALHGLLRVLEELLGFTLPLLVHPMTLGGLPLTARVSRHPARLRRPLSLGTLPLLQTCGLLRHRRLHLRTDVCGNRLRVRLADVDSLERRLHRAHRLLPDHGAEVHPRLAVPHRPRHVRLLRVVLPARARAEQELRLLVRDVGRGEALVEHLALLALLLTLQKPLVALALGTRHLLLLVRLPPPDAERVRLLLALLLLPPHNDQLVRAVLRLGAEQVLLELSA